MKRLIVSLVTSAMLLVIGATAYADLNEGLVAYYPFNGNANDESGNGNDGTVYGATLTMDRCASGDSAYSFDGVDDFIQVPDAGSLDITGNLTVAAWVRIESLPSASPGIVGKWYAPTSQRSYLLQVNSGFATDGTASFIITPSGVTQTYTLSSTVLSSGNWHHVAGVYDKTSLAIYVDGALESSTPYSAGIFSGDAPLTIGDFIDHGGDHRRFSGLIDEVCIYNRALSVAEIEELSSGCPNSLPTVSAGENMTISSEEAAATIIQGTATDPDPDDVLEYSWKEGETELLSPTFVGQSGECPLDLSTVSLEIGAHTLTLEVTDGQATSSEDMILTIDNSAPHAAASGGGVYEINTDVTLGGNVSDFDGDLLQYAWMEGIDVITFGTIQAIVGGTPVPLEPYITANFGLGLHTIVLQVDDGTNEPVASTIDVEIVDNTVPVLAPVASQTILWPPNHQMVEIFIQANASDNSGGPVTLAATVASNEPQDGLGDGDTAPDWTEPTIDQENGIISLQLRAERSGSGDGRVYTVSITATDDSGNSSTADVKIIVPHDKRKK